MLYSDAVLSVDESVPTDGVVGSPSDDVSFFCPDDDVCSDDCSDDYGWTGASGSVIHGL